jgi:hypothetical protein
MTMVVAGNPEGSKLYQLVTTSDVNTAMPPVNYGVDLSSTEKTKVYKLDQAWRIRKTWSHRF